MTILVYDLICQESSPVSMMRVTAVAWHGIEIPVKGENVNNR